MGNTTKIILAAGIIGLLLVFVGTAAYLSGTSDHISYLEKQMLAFDSRKRDLEQQQSGLKDVNDLLYKEYLVSLNNSLQTNSLQTSPPLSIGQADQSRLDALKKEQAALAQQQLLQLSQAQQVAQPSQPAPAPKITSAS